MSTSNLGGALMNVMRQESLSASHRHFLSPFRRRQLAKLFLVLFVFVCGNEGLSQDAAAQQTTTAQPTDKTDTPPVEEKPKQQKTETLSSAMTAGGDSAAGSI